MPTVNGRDLEPGCFINGDRGQYGPARLVEMADELLGTDMAHDFPRGDHGELATRTPRRASRWQTRQRRR
jgi:hypothetical protein